MVRLERILVKQKTKTSMVNFRSLKSDRHKNQVIWRRKLGGICKMEIVDRIKVVIEGMKREVDDLEMQLANHQRVGRKQ